MFGTNNISRTVAAAAAASAAALVPTTAFAGEDQDGPFRSEVYVQVDMGVSLRSHANFEGTKTGRMNVEDRVFPAALTIGWKPEAWQSDTGSLAVELQAFDRVLAVDAVRIGTTTTNPSRGKVHVGGVMANLRYELKVGGGIRPYLTGGVGIACPEIKNVPELQLTRARASKAVLATHFGGGIGFQPDASGKFSLWLGYDVLTTSSPRFETRSGVVPTTGYVRVNHVVPQTITLGARFAF
jgi:opacity protein-like surface antigen